MGRDILVDGYNVIKCAPSFQAIRARGLAAARAQLIVLLRNRYRHTPHQVIVVFDGDGPCEQSSHEQRIRLVYSRAGETADSVIARLAAGARQAGREVEIYSDDLEVQHAARIVGGSSQTTAQLERQIYAAPRDIERRARHRMAVRRRSGFDTSPFYKDGDDDEADNRASKPGKKKKKRRFSP